MPAVKRDLDDILDFYKKFESLLQQISSEADNLLSIGGQIESTLYNSPFATKKAAIVAETAKKVKSAVAQGEERVRQIERRVQNQIQERDSFER